VTERARELHAKAVLDALAVVNDSADAVTAHVDTLASRPPAAPPVVSPPAPAPSK
jgi:hypothetical protein